jgi:pimeloyl-ACP methyl ester carboxylesterase
VKALYLPGDRAFLRSIEVPGGDPPLLWLHGWQCSSTGELLPAAVQPSLRGRRSLLVDFLGHGYSDKPHDFAYSMEAHARTVVALIDALHLSKCVVIGHSMGGGVGVHVAMARPDIVTVLIMAEGAIFAPRGGKPLDGQTEEQFVTHGFEKLLEAQSKQAVAQPDSIQAAHLGMTQLLERRATYREAVSLENGTIPAVHSLLGQLQMPRWYLQGEASGPAPQQERDLATMGVGWRVVPKTGHPMGLQNPEGLANTIAELLVASSRT